jgi:hypothetical protein
MKRLTLVVATLAIASILGCAKKSEQASTTSSDSLLSTNPVEQPQGNMTPSTEYQGQTNPSQTATSQTPTTTTTKRTTTTHHPAQTRPAPPANPGVTVPAGTGVNVTIEAKISSETAHAGDTWSGTVKDPVVIGTAAPIPAGSTVSGVIEAARPAQKGERAMLQLAIQSVTVNGKAYSFSAEGDSVVAGSTRARNVGAVAGGAAAGALIGHAIGGGKGAVIGGLLGAGAATGGVAATKGYQVTIDEGSAMTFHVTHSVAIRD